MEDVVPAALRRERMLSLLRDREFMRVADLSSLFGISEVTVRSDLAALASRGDLQRVHGGAIVRDPAPHVERSYEESVDTFRDEKEAIGRHAARTVRSGETIILDVGSSTSALAKALVARDDLADVVVFTASLPIALALEPAIPRITVVVTGGTLRPKQHSLVDPMASMILDQVHATTAFIGCNGVHPDYGITNVNLPEAGSKKRMIAAGQSTVVVADGSKLGNISVVKVADLADIDLVITGPSAPNEVVDELRNRGVAVEIAETNGAPPGAPHHNGGNE